MQNANLTYFLETHKKLEKKFTTWIYERSYKIVYAFKPSKQNVHRFLQTFFSHFQFLKHILSRLQCLYRVFQGCVLKLEKYFWVTFDHFWSSELFNKIEPPNQLNIRFLNICALLNLSIKKINKTSNWSMTKHKKWTFHESSNSILLWVRVGLNCASNIIKKVFFCLDYSIWWKNGKTNHFLNKIKVGTGVNTINKYFVIRYCVLQHFF